MRLHSIIIILSFLLIIFVKCSDDEAINPVNPNNATDYEYTIPDQSDDGWETASVESVGMLLQPLINMVNMLDTADNHQIHNVLIFKDNKLVFEEYFEALSYSTNPPSNGGTKVSFNKDMRHYLASGSKSVTSVLFGIAVNQGLIDPDMDKKIIDYFPYYSSVLTGEKGDLTVKHLLTMTSGLDFDENTFPYGDQRNDVTALFNETDPIRFVLNKSMHASPGEVFHYNSGVTNVLGEIIRLQSEKDLLDFASVYLFEPLGIKSYFWQKLSRDYYFASGGLSIRPRDMAKIGSLFLNEGKWKGEQIISPEWIEASTKSYVVPDINITSGYGFQWWVESANVNGMQIDYFMSAGYGEQYMLVVPALNLIIVINGGYFEVPVTVSLNHLIDGYIVYSLFPEFNPQPIN
jgi:CubicO group peptidase (beta-lactamase class C family)